MRMERHRVAFSPVMAAMSCSQVPAHRSCAATARGGACSASPARARRRAPPDSGRSRWLAGDPDRRDGGISPCERRHTSRRQRARYAPRPPKARQILKQGAGRLPGGAARGQKLSMLTMIRISTSCSGRVSAFIISRRFFRVWPPLEAQLPLRDEEVDPCRAPVVIASRVHLGDLRGVGHLTQQEGERDVIPAPLHDTAPHDLVGDRRDDPGRLDNRAGIVGPAGPDELVR